MSGRLAAALPEKALVAHARLGRGFGGLVAHQARPCALHAWNPGTYWVNNYPNPDRPLYTFHESWTLPTPYKGDQPAPMASPYYVDPAAPAYPGVALL